MNQSVSAINRISQIRARRRERRMKEERKLEANARPPISQEHTPFVAQDMGPLPIPSVEPVNIQITPEGELTPLSFDLGGSETWATVLPVLLTGDVPHYTVWERVAEGVLPKAEHKPLATCLNLLSNPFSYKKVGDGWLIQVLKNYSGEHQTRWDPNSFWRISLTIAQRLRDLFEGAQSKVEARKREETDKRTKLAAADARRSKLPIPPIFPNKVDEAVDWTWLVENYLRTNAVFVEEDLVSILCRCMPDTNTQDKILALEPKISGMTWKYAKVKVLEVLLPPFTVTVLRSDLRNATIREGETPEQYVMRFANMIEAVGADEKAAKEVLLYQLGNNKLTGWFNEETNTRSAEPNFDQVVNKVKEMAATMKIEIPISRRRGRERDQSGYSNEINQKRIKGLDGGTVRRNQCRRCYQFGHHVKDCTQVGTNSSMATGTSPQIEASKRHISSSYVMGNSVSQCSPYEQICQVAIAEIVTGTSSKHMIHAVVTLNDVVFKRGLADTGASISAIGRNTLQIIERHGRKITIDSGERVVTLAEGKSIRCPLVRLKVETYGFHGDHIFVLLPRCASDVIVGRDLMRKTTQFAYLLDQIQHAYAHFERELNARYLTKGPHKGQNLCAKVDEPTRDAKLCQHTSGTHIAFNHSADMIAGIVDSQYGEAPKLTMEELRKKFCDYTLRPWDDMSAPEQVEITFHPQRVDLMKLIEEQLQANLRTSTTHSNIGEIAIEFVNSEARKLGCWHRQIPLSGEVFEKFKDQVQSWLKEGIVERASDLPCDTPADTGAFNINCFPVISGKLRFVHNFVPVNKLIRDDSNYVPSIEMAFNTIAESGARIFSKIDLKSAYLQIPLRKKDRYVCAFTCGNKRFQFVTAPLGLKVIPSQFQRWISALLQKADCAEVCVNHIDDIVVFSHSVETHAQHVNTILDALTAVNLTVNVEKCIFFATQLPVLGNIVTTTGVKPQLKKLLNMMEWERPSTCSGVMSLLGILNFFRKYLANATELFKPIQDILEKHKYKKKKFIWMDQNGAEDAYKKIFDALVHGKAILRFPAKGIPIHLATDASDYGLGAVLYQIMEGDTRYLGLNSRKLRDAETRYTVPKKELLSIVYHVRHYEHLLRGQKFILHTDSESIKLIFDGLDSGDKNRTIVGWISELAGFDFSIEHIEGKRNRLPDLASRLQEVVEKRGVYYDSGVGSDAPSILAALVDCSISSKTAWGGEEDALLKSAHRVLGHMGADAMVHFIEEIKGIKSITHLRQKCVEFCKSCDACTRVNSHMIPFAPLRRPNRLSPGEYIHMDLMHFPKSANEFEWVLVAVDSMTRFVWLIPLRSKNKDVVVEAALSIFMQFGFPTAVKSDGGGELNNDTMKALCDTIGVRHNVTVAYDHHSNGLVERQIRTVRDSVMKLVRDEEMCEIINGDKQALMGNLGDVDRWDLVLPLAALALNCRWHSSVRATPFSLMFGRAPFCFAGVEESTGHDSSKDVESLKSLCEFWDTYLVAVPRLLQKIKTLAQKGVYYPHKTGKFRAGDWVVIRNAKKTSKSEDSYGSKSYRVKRELPVNGHFEVDLGEDGGLVELPMNFLKKTSNRLSVTRERRKRVETSEIREHEGLHLRGSISEGVAMNAEKGKIPSVSAESHSKESCSGGAALKRCSSGLHSDRNHFGEVTRHSEGRNAQEQTKEYGGKRPKRRVKSTKDPNFIYALESTEPERSVAVRRGVL